MRHHNPPKPRPVSAADQHRLDFHREVKDLSTPDLLGRLDLVTRQAEKNLNEINRLNSELRDARSEANYLVRQHEVLTTVLAGRQ